MSGNHWILAEFDESHELVLSQLVHFFLNLGPVGLNELE